MRRLGGALLVAMLAVALLVGGCARKQRTVSFDFTLEQTAQGLKVAAQVTGLKIPQEGHMHVRLDDGPEAMPYEATYTIPKAAVSPGKHKVTVQITDVQHNPLGSPLTKEIDVQ
jgi:hypothetical protein